MDRRRINPIGEQTREWIAFGKQWRKDNPPLDNDNYICGICGLWVHWTETVLDHIIPRRPGNIFDPSNIQPAHWICNSRKSSSQWTPVVDKKQYEFLYFLSNM